MTRTPTGSAETAVEAAISRVLAAERTAHDAVADAEHRASAIDEAARERVQAIATRTERRMQRARAAFEDATQSTLAAIAAETSSDDREQPDAAERRALADAVVALAAKLTGEAA